MKKLCLIIPCFNEFDRLDQKAFSDYLNHNQSVDLYFVNDGSTDDTSSLLKEFEKSFSNAFFLNYPVNSGKAEVIRRAIQEIETNNYEFVGYWDADLATPFMEVDRFIEKFESNKNFVCVMGTRVLRMGTIIKRKSYRHYLGRVFATIVSMMLKLPVYDTQCGAKIFKASITKEIFIKPFVSRWFFDVGTAMSKPVPTNIAM